MIIDKKKIKIAFCYSGFIRNFKKNLEVNKKIMDYLNPDIFIYTYDSFGYKNSSNIPEPKNNKILNYNYFNGIPNIKKIIIEKFEYKNIENLEDKNITYYMHNHHAYPKNILSQLYCINKCNNLKKEYEKLNNFKYDFVFRIRPDSYFEKSNISSFYNIPDKNNKIFICNQPDKYWGSYCRLCEANCEHKYHENDISDIFAFGSSESMDYYSSLFLVANDIHKDLSTYNKDFFSNFKESTFKLENKEILDFKVLNTSNNTNKDSFGNECYLFYPESLLRFYLYNLKVLNSEFKVSINRNEVY
jgi:hypothetical protein